MNLLFDHGKIEELQKHTTTIPKETTGGASFAQ